MITAMKEALSYEYWSIIIFSFLIASTIAIAQDSNNLILPESSYRDLDLVAPVEIHGGKWREESSINYDWRSPEEQQKSRIRYGYDPSYEATQNDLNEQYNSGGAGRTDLGDTQAPSQIRFNF